MPTPLSPVSEILKLTKPQIAAFKKLGVETAADLLMLLPYRYLDFSKTVKIKDLRPGENISLRVKIKSINGRFSFRARISLAEAVVSDETGSLKVTWFNQPYLAKSLKLGDEIFLAGKAEYYNSALQLTNPLYEKTSDFPVHTARLVPVYHLTRGLYPKTIRNAVKAALPLAGSLIDILPDETLIRQKLLPLKKAVGLSHFPQSLRDIAEAQTRLNFEDLFIKQLIVQKTRLENQKRPAYQIQFDQKLIKQFVDSLPFALTLEQKQAAWDILRDLEKPQNMNRLLEGDVGSGKTAVALIAALQVMQKGLQAVLLCPTEILAKQHHETAQKYLLNPPPFFNARISLFTQSLHFTNKKVKTAKELAAEISGGMPGLIVGTHALLEKTVKLPKLALLIIDEQHRFGVQQRAELLKTGPFTPHLLSLSATPIPRTLKLALTGELEISQIRRKPQGRKPILTRVVNNVERHKTYGFIRRQIAAGRQIFVITPLIEEGVFDVKSAKQEFEQLQKAFPEFNIGLLHGKLASKAKEAVMRDFLDNKIQILVSTSVVEVGVDVPNASVMVIEGAERFGLSQLHQFRGRVGRAEHQSYCFLFPSQDAANEETLARLSAFAKTQDGFELAELDLKQRGFGKLYGTEQAGWDVKLFDPDYISLIPKARQEAKKLLEEDPNLAKYPLLQAKIKDQSIHFE